MQTPHGALHIWRSLPGGSRSRPVAWSLVTHRQIPSERCRVCSWVYVVYNQEPFVARIRTPPLSKKYQLNSKHLFKMNNFAIDFLWSSSGTLQKAHSRPLLQPAWHMSSSFTGFQHHTVPPSTNPSCNLSSFLWSTILTYDTPCHWAVERVSHSDCSSHCGQHPKNSCE